MELPSAYQAGKSPILSNKGAEKSGNGEKCIAFLQNFLPVPLPLRPLYYSKKALRGHRVAEKGLSASHRDTTEQRPAINGDKIRMIVLQQRTGVRYMKKRDAKETNRRETA